MMSVISLNSAKLSNLLSLQKIAGQQDVVQNRLATGLKVSSAIDNLSSYYTAQSLNYRTENLMSLLDTMSQGILTVKAANEAIEAGVKMLKKAKAVADTVLETAQPIAARVSNEAELLAAVDSGKKGLIVIDADITMSVNTGIKLQDGQSLVGARYLDKNIGAVSINFNFDNMAKKAIGIDLNQGSLLADITVNYELAESKNDHEFYAVRNHKYTDVKLHNVNITAHTNSNSTFFTAALRVVRGGSPHYVGSETTISGINNFTMDAPNAANTYAIAGPGRGSVADNFPIYSKISIAKNSILNLTASQNVIRGARVEISGNLNLESKSDRKFPVINGTMKINSTGKFMAKAPTTTNRPFYAVYMKWEKGAKVGFCNTVTDIMWQAVSDNTEEYSYVNSSNLSTDFPDDWTTAEAYPGFVTSIARTTSLNAVQKNYIGILTQYNQLIADGWYKGINLLDGQNLKVNFNEDRSSQIEIKGSKAKAEDLGLKTTEWNSTEDIEQSVSELESAIGQLRQMASEFGNYYSIVSSREEFTKNLINILTEGADKLTLADMNAESANMLALQTAQLLAVNSLSLASQAAQSVLKLF